MNKLNNILKQLPFNRLVLLPILFLGIYTFVGYCAIDKQAPVIESTTVDVLYDTDLSSDIFTISDNREESNLIDVEIDNQEYNKKTVGSYDVVVTATDQFSNTTSKTVTVNVIDEIAPVIELINDTGYMVDMEVNSTFNPADYFIATDNVDGDITSQIICSTSLDASEMGTQVVDVSVTDSSGNTTTESYEFYISDSTAPVIKMKTDKVEVDYGSKFNYKNYVSIKDNYDGGVDSIEVEGEIDTKKLNDKATFKITATDSSGNVSELSFDAVVKDLSAPVIKLKKKRVSIEKGKSINVKDYLVSANDTHDGNCKKDVKISGSVNTSKAGTYKINFTVTDDAGNTSTKTLTVDVTNPNDVANNLGIVSTAQTRIGCKYKYGTAGPSTFDCSGFTQWVYKKNGKSIPRSSSAQKAAGKVVSLSNLKAGDIVWRPGHVGIYVGGGKVIHAPRPGKSVTYTSLSGFKCGIRY